MARPVVFLLLVAVACICLSDAASSISCGSNEVYKTCGSSCPAKCGAEEPSYCIQTCVSGCQCKDGYVRNDKNQCVLPKNC